MSVEPRLMRIAANAGSGKTFALSGRYLALVRDGAQPGEILATTFTRKAAGEIRDRVLGRLADAAIHEKKLTELQESLPDASAKEATELLESLVAKLDRLQIRTLDSFFAGIALVSAAELDLPSDAQPIDPALDAALATGAIAQAADGDRDSVIATLAALMKGRVKRSLSDTIGYATKGLEPLWRDSVSGAWSWPRRVGLDADRFSAALAQLRGAEQHAVAQQRGAVASDLAEMAGIALDDTAEWIARGKKGIIACVRDGSGSYHRRPVHRDLIAAYRPLAEHADAIEWNELVRRTEATATLLASYVAALDAMRRDLGAVTFDDITRAVAGAADGAMSELFFRLDGRVAHLLLDEFQDTSSLQWRALRPIAEEIVAQPERSLFVVGDLKQSIYRWRGATPEIMASLERSIVADVVVDIVDDELTVSYRSSPEILDAVDEVFEPLATNPALIAASDGRYLDSAQGWCEGYAPHTAHFNDPGVVELHATEWAPEAPKRLELALNRAADLVSELVALAPGASIGVLAWRVEAVAGVLRRLRDRSIAATGMGRGALTDAPIVNAMLAALRFAQHPDDTLACFHASRAPLGAVLDLDAALHRAFPAQRGDASSRLRGDLWHDGPAQCVQRWAQQLDGKVDAREARRLEQLVEGLAAIEASGAGTLGVTDLDHVVEALRSLDVEEPGGGSVEVLTVHRAKGLEFDIVVLVDLDKVFKVDDAVAWRRDTPSGPVVRALRWSRTDTTLPEAAPLVAASIDGRYRETLSTLYVALTRAKRGLFAITAPVQATPKGEAKWNSTLAHVLRAAWAPTQLDAPCVLVRGDRSAIASAYTTARGQAPAGRLPDFAIGPRREVWEVKAKAASDIEHRVALSLDADDVRDRGTAAHEMLRTIEWNDALPSADEFVRASLARLPRRDERWHRTVAELVERAVSSAALRPHFTRGDLFGRVERELRFVRVLPEGVQEGSMDRIVFGTDKRGRQTATIIDFKTEQVDEREAAKHAARYRPQLSAYRDAVAERFKIAPRDVRCVVAFLDPALAVDVAPEVLQQGAEARDI